MLPIHFPTGFLCYICNTDEFKEEIAFLLVQSTIFLLTDRNYWLLWIMPDVCICITITSIYETHFTQFKPPAEDWRLLKFHLLATRELWSFLNPAAAPQESTAVVRLQITSPHPPFWNSHKGFSVFSLFTTNIQRKKLQTETLTHFI